MTHRQKKILTGATLLCCVLLSLFFVLFRRDDYFLNKTVRLISTRLTQFEYLSKGSNQWKFEFTRDDYTVFQFNALNQNWEVFAVHRYPGGTVPEMDHLIIEFRGGGLARLEADGKKLGETAYFILKFSSRDNPESTRGLIFHGNGVWRGIG